VCKIKRSSRKRLSPTEDRGKLPKGGVDGLTVTGGQRTFSRQSRESIYRVKRGWGGNRAGRSADPKKLWGTGLQKLPRTSNEKNPKMFGEGTQKGWVAPSRLRMPRKASRRWGKVFWIHFIVVAEWGGETCYVGHLVIVGVGRNRERGLFVNGHMG